MVIYSTPKLLTLERHRWSLCCFALLPKAWPRELEKFQESVKGAKVSLLCRGAKKMFFFLIFECKTGKIQN